MTTRCGARNKRGRRCVKASNHPGRHTFARAPTSGEQGRRARDRERWWRNI